MKTELSVSKFRGNGLLLFMGAMIAILLVVTVGGNILFTRFSGKPVPSVSAPLAQTPAAQTTFVASPAASGPGASAKPGAVTAAFTPPAESEMPTGDYGKVIRLGQQVFMETGQYASRYVGNSLTGANCHHDAGRKPDCAPLWASFIRCPAFRTKTGQVDTLASRIQGCFEYSMNGKAPPADDLIILALQTYAFWLAKGAPVGMPLPGSGYPKLKKPEQPADYARGEKVYAQNCALCHGADGLGQRAGDKQVFLPLWGPKSFNWGAGMHQLVNAAGFIRADMPLGKAAL